MPPYHLATTNNQKNSLSEKLSSIHLHQEQVNASKNLDETKKNYHIININNEKIEERAKSIQSPKSGRCNSYVDAPHSPYAVRPYIDAKRIQRTRPLSPSPSESDDNEITYRYDSLRTHQRIRDIAKARGAGFLYQIWLSHNRSMVQQYRRINAFFLEVSVASMTGLLMGLAVNSYDGQLYQGVLVRPFTLLSPSPNELVIPIMCLIVGASVGLAGAPAGVKIFSEEREVYWRETAAGHNTLAYYIGKLISSTHRFVISSLHFAALMFLFANPNITFWKFFLITLLQFFCVYGLAYVVAMFVRRENASLFAVVTTIFAAVFCGNGPTLRDARKWGIGWIIEMSYDRWAAEAWYSEELEIFRNVFEVELVSANMLGVVSFILFFI